MITTTKNVTLNEVNKTLHIERSSLHSLQSRFVLQTKKKSGLH